ncbi:putative glycosyltransferase [Cafeteria roenbergensis virus]|uniref:Putative glycosyltransferase n=1 Tax=Cafeteria roenbergensis virus (strain BV-PW1) TaxID=693272 RepID=E3T543_CROVB|nr:putative glycosyltransferase [Cafeteria roenbergensis virus BV-PW1]ADO67306.1 putative glycosyltransferase [Cafeteria roenbergensis virus BV-PW1]
MIKKQFIGPDLQVESTINLKSKLFADYIIFIETTNLKSNIIQLLENLLQNIRNDYNKEIYLLISSPDDYTKSNYVRYISNYAQFIKDFDMVIVLNDIMNNNCLTFTILQSIYYQKPLLMEEHQLLNDDFNSYPGIFKYNKTESDNKIKLFFMDKIKKLLSDELEESKYLELKKKMWNRNINKYYKKYFTEIINFLQTKNFKRKNIDYCTIQADGFNFYYYENITPVNLSLIYQNVENFLDLVKDYKKILLISSDYPGYGGAATQNNEIAKFLRLHGIDCKELYYLFNSISSSESEKIINQFKKPLNKFDFENMLKDKKTINNLNDIQPIKNDFFQNNIRVTRINDLEKDLENMEFIPDLIILKNHLNGKHIPLKFNNIFYLVAGIYHNNLNKFYYNLNLNENEKFFNKEIINLLKDKRVKAITNSIHTKKILENTFNIKSDMYYTNFLSYYPTKLPQLNYETLNKRPYDYGIICSDFNRPIKNLLNICTELSSQIKEKETLIFIGKNSNKYLKLFNNKNITCMGLISREMITEYLKKIKNVLINSYYESNSNLAIEAKFNGCNVIRNPLPKDNNTIRILITSTQKPGHGGSATNAYKLTKWLRNLNYRVAVLFFNKEDSDKINPDKIEGLFSIRDDIKTKNFYSSSTKINIRNNIINYLDGYPTLIYAFNYYTPILSRKLFPNSYLYYFVVGNPVLSLGENSIINKEISITKFLKNDYVLKNYDENSYNLEKESIQICDEIIFDQGDLNLQTISKVHPKFRYLYNNYYNYGINILVDDIIPVESTKEFELVIVSSNWKRLVKNPKLSYLLFKEFPEYRKLVIGNNSEMFDTIPNTTCLPLLDYDKTMKYIAKSKILLITSFSETGPNTLIEAFSNKCQVITSKNIGYHRYLKEYHLCEDVYELTEWKNKIKYIINNFDFLPVPCFEIEKDKLKFIDLINHKKIISKPNVLIVCGDKPYYGGAATNSYNLIKLLIDKKINVYGLFISYQQEGLDDPDNVGCVDHLFLDKNIKEKLLKWKELHNNFDIIFCKNYKVFTLIKKTFPNIQIIYSPSGLRQVTSEISKRKQFFQDMKEDQIELINTGYVLEEDSNWYNFIMKNDKYLENYALQYADYLLPNSQVTYDIIKYYYNYEITNKLIEPIYLTNIQFIEQTNFNFRKRKYDFAFIATNWKRATKNIWLVKSLIKKFKGSSYNILVVGSSSNITETDFPKIDYPNLEVKHHMLHDEMIKLYQNIKTVVITSFYDSNPNVLIEAIYCGCNVVTSDNVGNNENLRKHLVVKSPYKIISWFTAIEASIKKLVPYLGPSLKVAREQFVSLVTNLGCKQEAVGVYKVNASWDLETTIKRCNNINFNWIDTEKIEDFEEHMGRKTDIFSNIYLHLFKELVTRLEFKFSHYLFIDETVKISYRTKWENINIWILKSKEEVMYFNQAKFYFVRGNYPNFYQKLIPSNAYSIYYPATSFKYDYNIKNKDKIIKRDLVSYFNINSHPQYNNYSMILHHEDDNYFKQFDKCTKIIFNKFSLGQTFCFKNTEKIYDIIYVAQAVQKSKNHQLFFDFIKYCDINQISINIAYVSNKEILQKKYSNFYLPNENSKVKLFFYNHVTPSKLSELYNQSKINLVLSNRDCVPRVIIESIMCGCYNIATDLLSDGKYYYDGVCGELLHFDYAEVELLSSGMISYVSNPMIFKKLIKLVRLEYNHEKISKEGFKLYSLESTVNSIINKIT